MAAYDEAIPERILFELQEVFPNNLSSTELKARPSLVQVPENQFLLALDALLKSGLIDGKPLREGYNGPLHTAAMFKINTWGRAKLSAMANSTDNSTNIASSSNEQTFVQMRQAVQSIANESERANILSLLDELENARGTEGFVVAYQKFIAIAANYMTIFGPFIPALTQILSGN
jgi:hypothetical protein